MPATVDLRIESVAYRGAGVARADSVVHFVPGSCKGELVRAEIVSERKNFRIARVVDVLERSPDRLAAPDCDAPGCVYGHMSHDAEIRCKQEQLANFLERQAGVSGASELLLPPYVPASALGYRNKTAMHTARVVANGSWVMGYVGDDNHTVVDVPRCPLSLPAINEEISAMRADSGFWRWAGAGAKVTLRATRRDGVVVWADRPGETGARRDPPLPDLTEDTPVLRTMVVPAKGFWQMNGEVGGALVSAVSDLVRAAPPDVFVDLCCGVGVFGLSAAACGARHVAGLDSGRDVIRAAVRNARDHGFSSRAAFRCADASAAAGGFLSEYGAAGNFALVDPPRSGLDARAVAALLRCRPRTLVYVSCAPDTLARDLRALCAPGGFRLESARLFGMFPRTAHFETMCVLSAKSGS